MPLVMQGCATGDTRAPGTATRPVLSAQEAKPYTAKNYFARGGLLASPEGPWMPETISVQGITTPWQVGPNAPYASVQQALNAALKNAHDRQRIYIRVNPGVYSGAVYVPADAPPITLFGGGSQPQDVRLELALDSQFSPEQYRQAVNPSQQFREGDPAWYLYAQCANKTSQLIGTNCAAVVWSQSNDFQMVNLSVVNALLDTVDGGTHQGVALRTDGDRVQLQQVRLIGRQDTAYLNTSNRENLAVTDRISRVLVKESYIEGDVDYVFGRANVVFDDVEFHTVSTRGSKEAYVLAPNTLPDNPYGFLVLNSRFTGDVGYKGSFKAKLGRAWDQGAGKTGYLPGNTANGQVLIARSTIDDSYDLLSPWGAAATTSRPYKANPRADRALNDTAWNRLWEF
nr:putative acyl-CoA thioester hydrolase [uncultured Enterobacter sp.]